MKYSDKVGCNLHKTSKNQTQNLKCNQETPKSIRLEYLLIFWVITFACQEIYQVTFEIYSSLRSMYR